MYLDVGEYNFHIDEGPFNAIKQNLQLIYGSALSESTSKPVDFYVSLKCDAFFRRLYKPQITLYLGDETPFKPLPKAQAYPVLEWGMNWCIAATDFNHLIIHAAVLVKHNQAIIFPALPGSGKSTLSAFFANSGWQLYSDEMAIIDTKSLQVKPLYRPVCLKNESIDLVKNWFSQTIFTETTHDTQKGSVAHMAHGDWLEFQQYKPAKVAAIVFPKYDASSVQSEIYALSKVEGFQKISANAFNYSVLGTKGFDVSKRLIEQTLQLECTYNDLSDIEEILSQEVIKL